MPRAIPVPLRRVIWLRFQRGQPVAVIAAQLRLPPRTVRHLVQHLRAAGADALPTQYGRGGRRAAANADLRDATADLRRDHPRWGAGLIRVFLRRQFPGRDLPAVRTLQRWLGSAGLAPAPRGRRPASAYVRAAQPHDIWQMDAADQMPLQTGELVSWLRVVDECSGAVLRTVVFPPGVERRARHRRARRAAGGVRHLGLAGTVPRR